MENSFQNYPSTLNENKSIGFVTTLLKAKKIKQAPLNNIFIGKRTGYAKHGVLEWNNF